MSDAALKTRALEKIDEEEALWSNILVAAEGRLEMPGVAGDWSLKDAVAHLNGWRLHALGNLEAQSRGEPVPPTPWPEELTTDDEINAWIFENNRDRPAADVLAERADAAQRLRTLIESLETGDLADPERFPELEGRSLGESIVSGEFFSHFHDEHEPDIRRWLGASHLHHP